MHCVTFNELVDVDTDAPLMLDVNNVLCLLNKLRLWPI